MHLIGTVIATLTILTSIITLNALTLILAPIFGYSFAWIGHFFFEKNKPATFKNPIYSLYGDYVMAYYKVTGQLDREMKKALKKLDSEKAPSYSPYGMRVEKVFWKEKIQY